MNVYEKMNEREKERERERHIVCSVAVPIVGNVPSISSEAPVSPPLHAGYNVVLQLPVSMPLPVSCPHIRRLAVMLSNLIC